MTYVFVILPEPCHPYGLGSLLPLDLMKPEAITPFDVGAGADPK